LSADSAKPGPRRTQVKRHGKMPQRALFAWTAAPRAHIDAGTCAGRRGDCPL